MDGLIEKLINPDAFKSKVTKNTGVKLSSYFPRLMNKEKERRYCLDRKGYQDDTFVKLVFFYGISYICLEVPNAMKDQEINQYTNYRIFVIFLLIFFILFTTVPAIVYQFVGKKNRIPLNIASYTLVSITGMIMIASCNHGDFLFVLMTSMLFIFAINVSIYYTMCLFLLYNICTLLKTNFQNDPVKIY